MPSHEIAAVLEVRRHGLGPATLDAQILRRVVAAVAVRLRVARLAQALLLRGLGPVVLHEVAFVPQKGLGHDALHVGQRMTRRALAQIPLRLMLVTTEALLHGRERRTARFHHARVTRHALALDTLHPQMAIVIEGDVSVWRRRRSGQYGLQVSSIVTVTAGAQAGAWQRLPWSAIRQRVAARATQTRRFTASPAGETGQVQLVWETRRRAIAAGSGKCRTEQEQHEPHVSDERAVRSRHRGPRCG